MADFIQPYPEAQTQAKNLILAKKGSQGLQAASGQIDAYTRNQLLTLFAQELYNSIAGSATATFASLQPTPFSR